jgi:DUF1680 family protein
VNPDSTAQFPLQLRIPAWATAATVAVNGKRLGEVKPGTFQKLHL